MFGYLGAAFMKKWIFKNCNFWAEKALLSSYIFLYQILGFTSGSNPLGQLLVYALYIFRTNFFVAPSETASLMPMM